MSDNILAAVSKIQSSLPANFKPKVGLVLGSGLGNLVKEMNILASFSYGDLPGFFKSSVEGHEGTLIAGELYGAPVVCMKGRYHVYEGVEPRHLTTPLRVMKRLGCEVLLLTNAAGSLRKAMAPGSVAIIEDHINLTGVNALLGPNDANYGMRFVPMENAYDLALRQLFTQEATHLGIPLPSGVYVGVLGPSYETPAEIRAFQLLGGDLVGMSTVNEVIAARHCDLKVVALSAICNLASGLSSNIVNHEEVLELGVVACEKLARLVAATLPKLALSV